MITIPFKGSQQISIKPSCRGGSSTPPTANSSRGFRSLRSDSPSVQRAREKAATMAESATFIRWFTLERPSSELVQQRRADVAFLHIASHGVPNPTDPFQSHLVLWASNGAGKDREGNFSVSQISRWSLKQTSVAFLSACSTADAREPSLF